MAERILDDSHCECLDRCLGRLANAREIIEALARATDGTDFGAQIIAEQRSRQANLEKLATGLKREFFPHLP